MEIYLLNHYSNCSSNCSAAQTQQYPQAQQYSISFSNDFDGLTIDNMETDVFVNLAASLPSFNKAFDPSSHYGTDV